ncbi:hypothetical protein L1987_58308 [Smallanthus sonchifolius]|uniref:Uncharacterized protein n=1 Tax=Smallanthus sonchifolius TaxID=185202 RepID=A0ACB9DFC7_9ASTR|nr:hypothetical protein L1987_58308 [Smallanthus sonchifolius]
MCKTPDLHLRHRRDPYDCSLTPPPAIRSVTNGRSHSIGTFPSSIKTPGSPAFSFSIATKTLNPNPPPPPSLSLLLVSPSSPSAAFRIKKRSIDY